MADLNFVDLAETISNSARLLTNHYNAKTSELQFADGRPTIQQSQAIGNALEATFKIQRMLLGPLGSIMSYGPYQCDLAVLQAIHDFSIARYIPDDGVASFSTIAELCGIAEVDTRRILRHAVTNGIFTEPTLGCVAHTPSSRRLAHDPLMRSTVNMLVKEQLPATANFSRSLRESNSSTRPNSTAWGIANQAERPMILELQSKYPERAENFSTFIKLNWSGQNPFQQLLDNYGWASLVEVHIVDVGGGTGGTSIALAQAFPKLSFTVQDFKSVVEVGETELPESLRGRVSFMEHDFFAEQPVKGADIYLLRSILHDWPDDDCEKILKSLTPALKNRARVLINDFVMPEPGELPFWEERRARSIDLVMKLYFNARDREAEEWEPLFKKADSRYRFKGILPNEVNKTGIPTKKLLSIIEATWIDEHQIVG